jgi:ketosteroid isomerase-like protein
MIIQNTRNYIAAFDSKNLQEVSQMLDEEVVLFDPANPEGLFGKVAVLKMIEEIFKQFEKLNFLAKNIFFDGDNAIIEFALELNEKKLQGVDIIVWNGNRIKELRAYLY